MSIHRVNNRWVVTTKDGKRILGSHKTYKDALEQLRAIEANKKKK